MTDTEYFLWRDRILGARSKAAIDAVMAEIAQARVPAPDPDLATLRHYADHMRATLALEQQP